METERPCAVIAVRPATAIAGAGRLFEALEAAFPVTFAPFAAAPDAAALIAVGDVPRPVVGASAPPTIVFDAPAASAAPRPFALAEHPAVDRRLRGLEAHAHLGARGADPLADGAAVLARAGSIPVWTRAPGPAPVHRVAAPLPELRPGQVLRDLFDSDALALLALVQFLRSPGAEPAPSPPVRATLLFDDPNLRWRTYGFIDFGRLVEHADAHGYHAAMAMIPLDARHGHRPTVELFRNRADRLSLVLHGNNHVSRELLRAGDGDALGLAAQALRRVAGFERRYGLAVDRVMTPPHAMCSAAMTRALGELGFDALCAIHPYPWRERPPANALLAGWEPADFAGGCAVIPRLPLTASAVDVAVRAFLDQPLVLYGHHGDLRHGLDPLAATAARINRLGDVEWSSLGTIAAANAALRRDGRALRVRPFSNRLSLDVPAGVESIVLERPRGIAASSHWRLDNGAPLRFGEPAAVAPGAVAVRVLPGADVDPDAVPAPRPSAWPILRRLAAESRDRLRLLPASPV